MANQSLGVDQNCPREWKLNTPAFEVEKLEALTIFHSWCSLEFIHNDFPDGLVNKHCSSDWEDRSHGAISSPKAHVFLWGR